MASSLLLVILAVTVLVCISPSEALIINGVTIGRVLLGGTAVCPNSNLAIQNVIRQAPVELVCGSGSTARVLNSTLTDLTGFYSFLFEVTDTLVYNPRTCFARITIPQTACTLPVPTGFLRVPFVVLAVVQNLLQSNLLFLVQGAVSYIV